MSRAERRRKQREELKVIVEHKKREDFAKEFIKEFTPAQITKIHQYAEVLKEIEIKKGIEVIEKFGNVVMSNAIQGALAKHTSISLEDYKEILKTVREFGIEDADAITTKTKKDGKIGQITIDQGMEEFYMAIEKKENELINRAKELLNQKFNQKKVVENLKKEFSVPSGAANIACRRAKEELLNTAIKNVVKEAEQNKTINAAKVESVKEKVIKYLDENVDKIQAQNKADIIKTIKNIFKITESTADTYYYAWKKQYIKASNSTNKVEEEKINSNINKNLEKKKEVKKMKELSIVDQLKEKLKNCSNERVSLNAAISEIKSKLEVVERNEKAIKTAVNALEGVIL